MHLPDESVPLHSHIRKCRADFQGQLYLQMVSAGLLTKEKFIAWYFHCDEKQASKYIPQADALFGGI